MGRSSSFSGLNLSKDHASLHENDSSVAVKRFEMQKWEELGVCFNPSRGKLTGCSHESAPAVPPV